MSARGRCGRNHLLEDLVCGALPLHQEQELRAHTESCPRCRHELNWLEAERRLFRQRAGRDEVQHLWEGVARRSSRSRPVARVLVALAASVLVVLAAGQLAPWPRSGAHATDAAVAFTSEEIQTADTSLSGGVCSLLPGLGFHCGPAVPASFVATR